MVRKIKSDLCPRVQERGFSLVELTVVLVVVGLATAIAIPSLSGVSFADLSSSSSKLAGLVRHTYAQAALTGQAQKMTFDLEANKVTVQAAKAALHSL